MRSLNQFHHLFLFFSFTPKSKLTSKVKTLQLQGATEGSPAPSSRTQTVWTVLEAPGASPVGNGCHCRSLDSGQSIHMAHPVVPVIQMDADILKNKMTV